MIEFCRQWRTQFDDVDASDVVALLDISVDLIAPAAEVLSKVEPPSKVEPRSRIDIESISRVFDEQASVLRKWKDKNRHTIETKLVSQSPAKLASAANAVGNIAKLLSKSSFPCIVFPLTCRTDLWQSQTNFLPTCWLKQTARGQTVRRWSR